MIIRNNRKAHSGFALVYALGIAVLVSGVVVTFLLTTRTERSVAGGFAASTAARHLSNNVVSLVQAQIKDATTLGTDKAWVSQPGMIRVFDTGGSLFKAYKLYSGSRMVADTLTYDNDLPPDDWRASRSIWVDLNAPVTEPNGSQIKYFPIIDPGALAPVGSVQGLANEGFGIHDAPGTTADDTEAPMPVRWLYVLKNGELISPTGTSGTTATLPQETADNPIVGRVAFWTDDDSCKVNINTAGGGEGANDTFWDVPRASSVGEAQFGLYQPAWREYQRYPGHPGTVALSAVFPGLTLPQFMQLAPRYRFGGSQGGTVKGLQTVPITPKTERLYSSVDELMYNASVSGDSRTAGNLFQTDNTLASRILNSRRFFLTSHSRAPETNLFNTPRVSIWPIAKVTDTIDDGEDNLDPDRTTAYDRLIAFCSTLKTKGTNELQRYYFQREKNRDDPAADLSIDANGMLYGYLQQLTGRLIPGYGGKSFKDKYGADRDQILTEIYDYIRCANLYDDQLPGDFKFTQKYDPALAASNVPGHGYVVPARHANGTQGFGRCLTVSELGILFICNADYNYPASNKATTADPAGTYVNKTLTPDFKLSQSGVRLQQGEKRIQSMILLELSGVAQGWTIMRPLQTVRITGLNQLSVDGKSLRLPADDYTLFGEQWNWNTSFGSSMTGENPAFRSVFFQRKSPFDASISFPTYPFVGFPITITATTGKMHFSGGKITVEIYSGSGVVAANRIQTMQLILPEADFPVPDLATTPLDATYSTGASVEDWWSLSYAGIDLGPNNTTTAPRGRLALAQSDPGSNPGTPFSGGGWKKGCLIRPEFDVLRTIQPKHGDFRIVAAQNTFSDWPYDTDSKITSRLFQPHRYYNDVTQRMASGICSNSKSGSAGFDFPSQGYADGVNYNLAGHAAPDIAVDALQRPNSTLDFDNGISNTADGAYINKPDEGNAGGISNNASIFGYYKSVTDNSIRAGGGSFFSPNRIMPSPGMFGSLPTGVQSKTPWQTLLFRPQDNHPSAIQSPRDYLLMDLFWMPMVEPYAMSDRLSTAGKINLNYQIVPFTWIERSTAMRAVLKTEKLTAIPNADAGVYKAGDPMTNGHQYRYELAVDEMLSRDESRSEFARRFAAKDVFRSPAEICDIYMIPKGQTLSSTKTAFWNDHQLTGDNSRERIYTTLYSKLTTKSNTYTVHYRVQSLKKAKGNPSGGWTEGKDVVTGEYRGSTTIERFINPDMQIPNYLADPTTLSGATTLDNYYKWRVVENRQFAP